MARCPTCRQVADGDECGTCGEPLTEVGRQRKAAARAHNAVSAIQNFGATIQDDAVDPAVMAEIHRLFAAADVAQPAAPIAAPPPPPEVSPIEAPSKREVVPMVVRVPSKPDDA